MVYQSNVAYSCRIIFLHSSRVDSQRERNGMDIHLNNIHRLIPHGPQRVEAV